MKQWWRRLGMGWKVVLIGAALAVAAGALGLYVFFEGDPPPPVDIEAISPPGTTTTTASETPSTTVPAAAPASPDGVWVVDTSVGVFAIDQQTDATFVGFRVDEVLRSIGSTTAVGRTPGVTGSLEIVGTSLTAVEVSGDLTLLVSDESRRDGAVQRSLNTQEFPTAVFQLTDPIDLGEAVDSGAVVDTTARGTLTLKGTTRPVEVGVQARNVDGRILVVGSFEIEFDDYDITPPSAISVLSVEDHGIIEFQLWFTRGEGA